MSTFVTNPPFLDNEIVTTNTSVHHPISASIQAWSKLFWRVRQWSNDITVDGYAPANVAGTLATSSGGTPTDELDLVDYPLAEANYYDAEFTNDMGSEIDVQFALGGAYSPPEADPSGFNCRQMQWQRDGTHFLSVFCVIEGVVSGVGSVELYSIYSQGLAASIASGLPLVTRYLTLDSPGYNLTVPLYGIDQLNTSLDISPAYGSADAFWSYDGRYNTTTGAPL